MFWGQRNTPIWGLVMAPFAAVAVSATLLMRGLRRIGRDPADPALGAGGALDASIGAPYDGLTELSPDLIGLDGTGAVASAQFLPRVDHWIAPGSAGHDIAVFKPGTDTLTIMLPADVDVLRLSDAAGDVPAAVRFTSLTEHAVTEQVVVRFLVLGRVPWDDIWLRPVGDARADTDLSLGDLIDADAQARGLRQSTDMPAGFDVALKFASVATGPATDPDPPCAMTAKAVSARPQPRSHSNSRACDTAKSPKIKPGAKKAAPIPVSSANGQVTEIADFVPGVDVLRVSLTDGPGRARPVLRVAPSTDGGDGMVEVDGTTVAILRGAPQATIRDIYLG